MAAAKRGAQLCVCCKARFEADGALGFCLEAEEEMCYSPLLCPLSILALVALSSCTVEQTRQ